MWQHWNEASTPTSPRTRTRAWERSALRGVLVCAFLASGCNVDRIVAFGQGEHSRIAVSVGEHIDITLRGLSFGSYLSPPAISTPAVMFLNVTTPDEGNVPGGPAQRFSFRAMGPGTAIITFTHAQPGNAAVDTIDVR